MEHQCNICLENYEDEDLLQIHMELVHNNQNLGNLQIEEYDEILQQLENNLQQQQIQVRPSVIQYAPKALKVNLLADAMPRSIVRHFKIQNEIYKLFEFLDTSKPLIIETLNSELRRLNIIKFSILVDALFENVENQVSPRGFITKIKSALQTSNIEEITENCLEEIKNKIAEHQGRGSGWSLSSIISMDIRVHKHGYGDRGSSYIQLPPKIAATQACVNVKNDDNECFRYAMLTKFVPPVNAHRPNNEYKQVWHRYNFRGITFPVSLSDIKIFEKLNLNTSVNVFGLDDSSNVYPLKVCKTEKQDHTDLLLIKSGDVSHYVYIKNFNMLMSSQLSKQKSAKQFANAVFVLKTYKKIEEEDNGWKNT